MQEGDSPVDADDDPVQGKWSMAVAVLTPDRMAMVAAFMGRLEGIVDARNNEDEPRYRRGDSVRNHAVAWIGTSLLVRVNCSSS